MIINATLIPMLFYVKDGKAESSTEPIPLERLGFALAGNQGERTGSNARKNFANRQEYKESKKPSSQPVPLSENPIGHNDSDFTESREVVGLLILGSRHWQHIPIEGMEVIARGPDIRYFPLIRILTMMRISLEKKNDRISFKLKDRPEVVIDIKNKTMQIAGSTSVYPVMTGISMLTREQEIFVPSNAFAEALGLKLQWDQQNYSYEARTDVMFPVWEQSGKSLWDVLAEEEAASLPDLHGLAQPEDNRLYFVQLDFQGDYTNRRFKDGKKGNTFTFFAPQQTLWGSLLKGNYKLGLTEPSFSKNEDEFDKREGVGVALSDIEWRRSFKTSELVVGDMSFGLNNINMPSLSMTGVRYSGLWGKRSQELAGKSGFGMNQSFIQPYFFDGIARAGSKVTLYLNDREQQRRSVISDMPDQPGYGSYQFDEVDFTPGIVNRVRIEIVDPDGVETILERDILGSAYLLPKGEMAYLTGLGTKRDVYTNENSGFLGFARLLYGLTPRMTLGTTAAYNNDFHGAFDKGTASDSWRDYPKSGWNLGSQLSWMVHDTVLLSGDVALSLGQPESQQYTDYATKFTAEWYPTRNLRFYGQHFRYGPDFFDGSELDLCDRQGFFVNGEWRIYRGWNVRGGLGRIMNNLDDRQEETLIVDFQNIEGSCTAFPWATFVVNIERLEPNWDARPLFSTRFRTRVTPVRNLDFYADIITGDTSTGLGDYADLFENIRLPGLDTQHTKKQQYTLRYNVNKELQLSTAYKKQPEGMEYSLAADYRSKGKFRVNLRTEIGLDVNMRDEADKRQNPYFDGRCEFLLDETGKNSIGISGRLEDHESRFSAFFKMSNLFAINKKGMPTRITQKRINPDRGAIKGTVFVDYNANGKRDPDEPGVPDIQIRMIGTYTDVTDRRGQFILPAVNRKGPVRVSVVMDTVPATYDVVHGTQLVVVERGQISEINMALTPMISLMGIIVADMEDGSTKPLDGVRVVLVNPKDDQTIGESFTASDGSYYLMNVRPGKYLLRTDDKTIPENVKPNNAQQDVIVAVQKDFKEITLNPLRVGMVADSGVKTK